MIRRRSAGLAVVRKLRSDSRCCRDRSYAVSLIPRSGLPGLDAGEQILDRRLVNRERIMAIFSRSRPLVSSLDYPVHLNLIPGTVHFGQGQPVQQASRSVEPGQRREEFAQPDRIVDRVRVLQEYIRSYRLGREERTQIEQVLRIGG